MKTKYIKLKLVLFLSVLGLVSCEINDDASLPDPTYNAPLINIVDGSTINALVGRRVIYPQINISANVGITNFKVTIDDIVRKEELYDGSTGRINTSFDFQIPQEWIDSSRDMIFEVADTAGNITSVNVNIEVGVVVPTYTIEDVEINGQDFKKLTGIVNIDETLDNTSLWIISGTVNVAQQTKLTITAGTQVYAETSSTFLVIDNLGLVDWQGTATNPVVFNALANAPGQGAGNSNAGQWHGIQINGSAGSSSAGVLRYVRVMYPGSGANSLMFNNLGDGTTIEYIQLYKNLGRGIRIEGGIVNLKYMVSTNSADSGFRMDGTWNGFGQFWVVNKDIVGGNAIEGRRGTPILSNVTITGLGLNRSGTAPNGGGFRIRDGGNAQIYNAVVSGVNSSLRYSDGSEQGVATGRSFFVNSASFNNADDSGTGFHGTADFFNPTDNDYVPRFNNSVTPFAIVNSYIGTSTLNSTPAGVLAPFFTDVNYIGAVEVGNDWTIGWCVNLDGTVRQ